MSTTDVLWFFAEARGQIFMHWLTHDGHSPDAATGIFGQHEADFDAYTILKQLHAVRSEKH